MMAHRHTAYNYRAALYPGVIDEGKLADEGPHCSRSRFYCLSRQEHIEPFLLMTKLTRRVIAVADIWLEGVVGKRG